jgi:hypothetical protein
MRPTGSDHRCWTSVDTVTPPRPAASTARRRSAESSALGQPTATAPGLLSEVTHHSALEAVAAVSGRRDLAPAA